MKKEIKTDKAPLALGPYSQAVETNGTIYVSGQLPINPSSGMIEVDDVASQTRRVFDNLKNILEKAGYSLSDVVKTTVLLKDINDFNAMNNIYAEYFERPYPARIAYEVKALPKDAKIEIELIATK